MATMTHSDPVAARVAALIAEIPDIPRADTARIQSSTFSYRGYEAVAAVLGPLMRKHGLWLAITECDVTWMDRRVTVRIEVDWCSSEGRTRLGSMTADATPQIGVAGAQTTAVRHLLVLSLLIADSGVPEREHDPQAPDEIERPHRPRPVTARPAQIRTKQAKQQLLRSAGGNQVLARSLWNDYELDTRHDEDEQLAAALAAAAEAVTAAPPPQQQMEDE